MDLNIDKARMLRDLAKARDEAIRSVEACVAALQVELEQAASVLADHPEEFSILNADAAYVVDGEIRGHNRMFNITLDGGYSFNREQPDRLTVPEGKYRAIVLFIKRGPLDPR